MGEKDEGVVADSNEKVDLLERDGFEKEDQQQIMRDEIIRDEIDRMEKFKDHMSRVIESHMEITIKSLALPGQMTAQLPGTARESATQLLITTQKAIEAASWDLRASIDAMHMGNLPELLASRAQELTQVLWEGADKQYTTFSKYWWPAQLHTMNIVKTGIESAKSAQEASSIIIQTGKDFDPRLYGERIRDLATYMWQQGSPIIDPLRYWLSAEKHILTVASRAIRAATSPSEAGRALAAAIETFNARDYFESIRREAYSFWGTTRSHGHDVEDWLKAEDTVRDRQ